MNGEKQRIAIAETCGWNYHKPTSERGDLEMWWNDTENSVWSSAELPDYLNDLNAIVQVVFDKFQTDENLLSVRPLNYDDDGDAADMRRKYESELYRTLRRLTPHDEGVLSDFDLIHATAAQRAEAFLRTLGLWVDQDT